MRFQKRFKIMFILCTLVILLITSWGFPADDRKMFSNVGGIPANGWQMPIDVESKSPNQPPTQEDWLKLGWESFIALNWPAETGTGAIGGQPKTKLNITDPGAASFPTVWMTFLGKEQVFQQNANDPGTWSKPSLPLPTHTQKDKKTGKPIPILGGLSKSLHKHSKPGEFDEAGTLSPLIDQNGNYVLYEIRLNQSEFEYIKTNMYYNANYQKDAFKTTPNTFKHIPDGKNNMPIGLADFAKYGATEIKASWRILITDPKAANPDIPSRYYTMRAYFETPDKKHEGPYTLGLVGLHILRLTPSTHTTWFWATFEQIDNVNISTRDLKLRRPNGKPLTPSFHKGYIPGSLPPIYANGYSYQPDPIKEGYPLPVHRPVEVSRVNRIPGDVERINAFYQAQLKDSPWQYYQMVNTLNPSTTSSESYHLPVPKGNSAYMNTGVMVNTTMETYTQVNTNCNSCHAYALPQGTNDYKNQIFTFLLGDAQSPSPVGTETNK